VETETTQGNDQVRKYRTDLVVLEAIETPDKGELIDDAYIVLEHERENRYNLLVESLKTNGELSFDYKSNVYERLKENKLSAGAEKYIREVLP
jgi:hypothetical protein